MFPCIKVLLVLVHTHECPNLSAKRIVYSTPRISTALSVCSLSPPERGYLIRAHTHRHTLYSECELLESRSATDAFVAYARKCKTLLAGFGASFVSLPSLSRPAARPTAPGGRERIEDPNRRRRRRRGPRDTSTWGRRRW